MDYLGGHGPATGIRGGIPGYLLPTVSKDFAGLIPRPSTPERALRWLKDALLGLVKPLTWHSFRVFIPDCAFQMGIPRERRMYLGNWLTESTADVYVREKRNVVVEIWGQVAQKVPNLNLGPGRERREDLNPLPPPAVEITDAGPDGHNDQTEGEGEASPTVPSGSAIDSLMVIGGTGTRGHTSEGQGPVSHHPGLPPSCCCGGQTHRQRRPGQKARLWGAGGDRRPLRSRSSPCWITCRSQRPMASAHTAGGLGLLGGLGL